MSALAIDWKSVARLVVVAAHPDDETLGAAGLLKRASDHGVPTEILVATLGEKSHPDSTTHSAGDLARLRVIELRTALAIVAPGAHHRVLGIPDGEVKAHAPALEAEIATAARGDGTALIVAPWSGDGHTDHDGAGAAAARAASTTGSMFLEYPIWMWHWASPDSDNGDSDDGRRPQDHVPWPALRRLELSANERSAKAAAVASHASQVLALSSAAGDEALLSAGMLAHFERSFETFIDISGHFTPTGQVGAHWRQQQFDAVHHDGAEPWAPDSWYEQRKRGLLLAGLPRAQFRSGLELGCSTGTLTAALALRCEQLMGIDASREAVASARRRTAGLAGVSCVQGTLPADWPPGLFDLFVLSESGYYFTESEIGGLVDRMVASALPDAQLAACHWRHPIAGWPLGGADVHRLLRADGRLELTCSYVDEDFRLDYFGILGTP